AGDERAGEGWGGRGGGGASRGGATAIWDGRELLVVGGAGAPQGGKPAPLSTIGFAYDPATNRWRLLPPMESGRFANAAAWTGKTLLLWGGAMSLSGTPTVPPHGVAYDPTHDRWAPLPQAPLLRRLEPTPARAGRQLIAWGGAKPGQKAASAFFDGAAFTPRG